MRNTIIALAACLAVTVWGSVFIVLACSGHMGLAAGWAVTTCFGCMIGTGVYEDLEARRRAGK